ncbi:hypothetical protein PCANB_002610 [Pneumocystis canis]|nr:hypothetical protein PCK1_002764 [Pneumocystis canis]KAG5438506.1 hypothetical protein PCANB_002610 [Pneumocystis canis]
MIIKNEENDQLKKIEALEVSKHDNKEDLYMVINKMVYNVTPFINEHPGGEEVLLDLAGQDATNAFEDVGHSDEARNILKKLLIGKLEGTMEQFKTEKNSYISQSKNSFNLKIYVTAVVIALMAFLIYVFVFKKIM